jgi:hypothetical protein
MRSNLESKISDARWDSGKRAADHINLHLTCRGWDELQNKWMAFKIEDGSTDDVLYDSKQAATRHQPFEQQCYYVSFRNLPGGANAKEMAIMLQFAEDAYDAGMRFVDPDAEHGGREAIMTAGQHDYYEGQIQRDRIQRFLRSHERFLK